MADRRWRSVRVGAVAALVLVASGCLGQDYLDAPLDLESFDHGWRANVEPDEEFGAHFFANPLYPDESWQLTDYDPAVVRLVNSGDERAFEGAILPVSEFSFAAVALGESPLVFELVADGMTVGRCEYTLAVVEDACEPDEGFAAARCRQGKDQPHWSEFTAYEYGTTVTVEPSVPFQVGLFADARYPEAPWLLAELDESVAKLASIDTEPVREPGDWDTSDRDKPWYFLPMWRFTFEAHDLGETPLVLEVVDDGERVAVYEITVNVVQNAGQ